MPESLRLRAGKELSELTPKVFIVPLTLTSPVTAQIRQTNKQTTSTNALVNFLAAISKFHANKQLTDGRVGFGSQFEGAVHHGRECVAMKPALAGDAGA